jgi:hypothetical protein
VNAGDGPIAAEGQVRPVARLMVSLHYAGCGWSPSLAASEAQQDASSRAYLCPVGRGHLGTSALQPRRPVTMFSAEQLHVDVGSGRRPGPLKFGDPLFHRRQQLAVEFFDRPDERAGRHGCLTAAGGGELDLAGLVLPSQGRLVVAVSGSSPPSMKGGQRT